MKQLIIFLFALMFCSGLWAQHPGFSKRYRYSGDTLLRSELVSALHYDSTNKQFFFCNSGILISAGTFYTTFYKTDEHGNIIKETIDSLFYGSVGYNSVTESNDGEFLYWGGYSFVFGDTTTTSWKIRKTDKNLNVIWEKLYHSPYASNFNYNIKTLDSGRLMLLCFDYTNTNGLGMPIKRSTLLMRIIDSSGNIITDKRPLELDYTNGAGLERTNDNGFMVNGTSDWKVYNLKTDSTGNHLWHHFHNTNTSKSWFNMLSRQMTSKEWYYNAGGVFINSNNDAISLATKTDSTSNEIWQRQINKNGVADEFYSVASGKQQKVVFAGSTFIPELQYARGWMVMMDENGNELWNKLYTTPHPNDFHDYIFKIVPLPDGGFAAAGTTYGQNSNGNWTQQAWLLRVDSNGCYDAACSEYTAIKPVEAPKESINVFPNPTPGPIHLINTSPFPKGTVVTLSDAAGRVLKTLESPAGKTQQVYQLRGSLLPGVYFIKIYMDGAVQEKKVVLTF